MGNSGAAGADHGAWIGRVIDGRYRVVELLGEGGMGSVFVAEHLSLHKQVAVKTIRVEFAANSQAAARFAREALLTGQIDHPHVVSAIDFGTLPDGGAYLVTQLVRGESLGARMRRGPLTWQEACELGAQIADALAAAHAIGVVHRDLKPDNILLERRHDQALHAKVVDFGIARVSGEHGGSIADASQPITRMGAVIGTPGYMAPEQATGGEVDARVDLYALGVILWECCAGQPLWAADSASQLLIAQLTRAPPRLFAELAPPVLAGLIDELLARAPADRPASARVVRDRLRALTRADGPSQRSEAHRQARAIERPPTAPDAGGGPTVPEVVTGKRARPLLWLGLACGLAAALWLAVPGSPSPKQVATADAAATPQRPAKRGELPARRELLATLPDAYVEAGQVLLLSTDRGEREKAGERIAAAEGAARAQIPAHFHQIAAFEAADECADKRAILREIEAADDLRVLWALRNLQELPRDGCRGRDCLGCLRGDLERVTAKFEAAIE